jgi:glycine/D-amino acid oxidase-like deaminating enzyme
MNVSSERSVSLWMSTKVLHDAPVLDREEKADVVVVGSGIAGISVAWELAKAGKDVVILDRGPIGKGMTARTTAHLTAQCDDGFHQLIGRRGQENATAWYQSQAAGIDRIEANQKELGTRNSAFSLDWKRIGHLQGAAGNAGFCMAPAARRLRRDRRHELCHDARHHGGLDRVRSGT